MHAGLCYIFIGLLIESGIEASHCLEMAIEF